MTWEDILTSAGGNHRGKLGIDEVSIVQCKVNSCYKFRVNICRENFPEDVDLVTIRWDKVRGLIGIFKVPEGGKYARKLSSYGPKSRLVYISLPKSIVELGFSPGRYKVSREEEQEMYFCISPENLVWPYDFKRVVA